MANPRENEMCFKHTVGELRIIKLSSSASLPIYKGGGYQIHSARNYTVPAGGSVAVETDLLVSLLHIH